jgi:hypothetical protein
MEETHGSTRTTKLATICGGSERNSRLSTGPVGTVTAQPPFSAGIHTVPSFDAVELLPPPAQELLQKLRDRRADLHAVMVPHGELQEAITDRITASNRLTALQAHPQEHGSGLPETDPRVVAQKRLVDKFLDHERRLRERSEAKALAWQAASGALSNVETWLRDGRPHGTVLEAVEIEPPKLNKNETVIDAVERHRRRVRELRSDLHRIQSAPFPSAYSKQRAREFVEQLAQRGQPDVSSLIELDRPITFSTVRQQAEVIGSERHTIAVHETIDIASLLAWLMPDLLIKRLSAEIDTESDDPASLSHADRELRSSEVAGDLLAVEFDEAALVFRAQSEGMPIEHRADCSPLAILQMRLVTVAPTDGQASSMEHEGFNLIGRGQ